MKLLKLSLLLIILSINNQILAQWSPGANTTTNGSVGIGTGFYQSKLNISQSPTSYEQLLNIAVADAPNDYLRIVNSTGTSGQFIPQLKATHTSDNRQVLFVTGKTSAANDNGNNSLMAFTTGLENGPVINRPLFEWKNYTSTNMIMDADGNVGIGTVSPISKLSVNGDIRSTEVIVKANIDVPDYVFAPDYKLRTLKETKQFITENQHLPEIPSAKEMEANGMELGVMNLKLLKKIEELTLHQIELLERLEKMEAMQVELDSLKGEVESLKKH